MHSISIDYEILNRSSNLIIKVVIFFYFRYFIGDRIVLRCVRPIAAGEMISENYGPIFTKRTLAERQRNLGSRYWFKCSCQACQEDWPTFKNMDNNARIR